MAIRCPGCGKFLSSKDKKCPNCGAILGVEPEEVKVEEPVQEAEIEEEEYVEEEAPQIRKTVILEAPEGATIAEAPRIIRDGTPPIVITKYKNLYVQEPVDLSGPSYFDGRFIQFLGWTLLGFLVSLVTLGICYPLAYAWIVKWECKHTVISGYRQKFVGKAGGLIPRWLLWSFLTIITLTIFGWWTPVRLRKWKVARIILVEDYRAK